MTNRTAAAAAARRRGTEKAGRGTAHDRRVTANGSRRNAKASRQALAPRHWSFLIGYVAVAAFVVLALTGAVLVIFYQPSTDPVVYTGSAELYRGRELPAAFASVIAISHDVPGGQLLRRVHRVATHVFLAALFAHLIRVLLTGAFRRPRRPNYLLGLALLGLVWMIAWTGHNLPFDVVTGSSLRIGYSLLQAVPWIGEEAANLVFGQFPPGSFLWRGWLAHVLLLPAVLVAGLALHLVVVARQTHTQLPMEGIDEDRAELGEPAGTAARRRLLVGLLTSALIVGSSVLVPWGDVGLKGPYIPEIASNDLIPDWYAFLADGALRIVPPVSIPIPGAVVTNPLVVDLLVGVMLAVLVLYPFVERRRTRDRREHHALQHPMEVPGRLAFVTAYLTLAVLLSASAGSDLLARLTGLSLEQTVWLLRGVVLLAPPLAAWIALKLARGREPGWDR